MENLQSKDLNQKETIAELAHRHIKDESHTTSDEELKNARVVFSQNVKADEESLFENDNTTVIPPVAAESEDRITAEKNDKDEERPIPNPYDVLGG